MHNYEVIKIVLCNKFILLENYLSKFYKMNEITLLKYLIILSIVSTQITKTWGKNVENFNSNLEFIILHNNDMHARFEETGAKSAKCNSAEKIKNLCYGGFARSAYEVNKYRELAKRPEGIPVLYLNAGDTYTGTPWFTIFKHKIAADFLNVLQPDTTSLGNHEFDEGVDDLLSFLDSVEFPVLACNLNLTKTPKLVTSPLKKSVILNVNNVQIGVIGYLTPDTKFLSYPNTVEYFPEIDSINKESKVLKSQGVKIIIALGHSGFIKDKEIALNCPDIDIVIGGHTNTFLYNGPAPNLEKPEGPYPTVIEQANGKRVPVVQAYAYTKYLGYLKVKFDNDGNLLSWTGQPILLDYNIPQNNNVLELLEKYRPNITELENTIVGYTKVDLEGSSEFCRYKECNMGNMVTDAMVYIRITTAEKENSGWTDAAIAFMQGGGIRSSIPKNIDGSIKKTDLFTVLPFNNPLYVVEVSGKAIKNALEKSASKLYTDSNGGFLQMSGIHVVYDMSKPIGHKAIEITVRCADCIIPQYSKLNESERYKIILNSFILDGGDGYNWSESSESLNYKLPLQYTEQEAALYYIQQKSPVYPELEGRIKLINNNSKNSNKNNSIRFKINKIIFLILLLFIRFT